MVKDGEELAQALWYVEPGQAEIRPEPLRSLAHGQVRVRSRFSAISRGTEALIAAGRVPQSEYQRMRAPFMGGSFPFPVKYGYAAVGSVEAGPAALIGGNVFASLRADRRGAGNPRRHRPGARRLGPRVGCEVCNAGRRAGRLRFRLSRQRDGSGACHSARYRWR